jgi:hypothetical protein
VYCCFDVFDVDLVGDIDIYKESQWGFDNIPMSLSRAQERSQPARDLC